MITIDFKRLDLTAGDRILDIGCGSGRHVGEAVRQDDVYVVGADVRMADVTASRRRLILHEQVGECHGRWGLLSANLLALPFADETFDLVICSEVLEHIDQDGAAVDELIRVLKPGKNLAISVPRWYPERICWSLSEEYASASDGHVRIYRKGDITRLFNGRGMTLWASHFAHGWHTPYWWLKCLIGPNRDQAWPVQAYHQFLIWDMFTKPGVTRFLEKLMNPLMGKSLVMYLRKGRP